MKIACLQLNSGSDMDDNIARIETLIRNAAGQGASLVALPENAFLMEAPGAGNRVYYTQATHPGLLATAEMAKLYSCWILVGSAAIKTDDYAGKAYNRSLLFNPAGEITSQYDKIHLFDVELPGGETYAESARMLAGAKSAVADIEGVKFGLSICYDVRFPHLYRALAKAGAQVLSVPAAFTATTGMAHWHILLRARAIENGCYVIAPAQTGTHPGNRKTYGHALVVDPWGEVIADAGEKVGFVMADFDMDKVRQTRARLPSLMHDREFSA